MSPDLFNTCVIIGGCFLVLWLFTTVIGVGDLELDLGDSDSAFAVLSLATLGAFILMFGLGGILATDAGYIKGWQQLIAGISLGLVVVYFLSKLLISMRKLGSESPLFHVDNYIGSRVLVSTRVTMQGGAVQISTGSGTVEVQALTMCVDDGVFPSGSYVEIANTVAGVAYVKAPFPS